MTPPDHRGLGILALAAQPDSLAPTDAVEGDLFYLVKTGKNVLRDVTDALAIYDDAETRHALNAMILSKADDALICDALEIPLGVCGVYRTLFFDRGVFKSTVQMRRYVATLKMTASQRCYYDTALNQGAGFLANRLRVGARSDVDPKTVLRSLLNDSYDRFLAHRGMALTTETAKEALKWGQFATSTAVAVIDKGSDRRQNTIDHLKLVLETRDETHTAKTAEIDLTQIDVT